MDEDGEGEERQSIVINELTTIDCEDAIKPKDTAGYQTSENTSANIENSSQHVLIVIVVFWVYFCVYCQYAAFSILYVEYVQYFGVERYVIGVIAAVYGIGSNFTGVICSGLTRCMLPRTIAIIGAIVSGLSSFAISLANSIFTLGCAYFVLGLGSSLTFMASSSVVQQHFTMRRTLASAITFSGMSVSSIIVSPMTRLLIDFHNWRAAMMVLACCNIQSVWLSALLRPKEQSGSTRNSTSGESCLGTVAKTFSLNLLIIPSFLLYSIATILLNISLSAFTQHIVNFAIASGASKQMASIIPSINGVVTFISRLAFGFLTILITMDRALWYSIGIFGIGVTICFLNVSSTISCVVVVSSLVVLWNGLNTVVQQALLVDLIGISNVFGAIGIFMVSCGIGQVSGPPLAGALVDLTDNYSLCFYVVGGFAICGGVVSLLIIPAKKACSLQSH